MRAIRTTVTLGPDKIATLSTTTVQIVPAPGQGNIIQPSNLTLVYKYNGTAYVFTQSTFLSFVYGGLLGNWLAQVGEVDGFMDLGYSALQINPSVQLTLGSHDPDPRNQPLLATFRNANGTPGPSFTTGNGLLTIILDYDVISVADNAFAEYVGGPPE